MITAFITKKKLGYIIYSKKKKEIEIRGKRTSTNAKKELAIAWYLIKQGLKMKLPLHETYNRKSITHKA